jgi:hypothetical protein
MSATLLSTRLKQLEAEGIVERRRGDGKHWTYHLTEAGTEFVPLLGALGTWGRRWTRRDLAEGELDLGLLIWGLEHCADGSAFGAARTVVALAFTDQPEQKAHWWFVNRGGGVELCVTDPGFGIDLYLSATLRDMTHIYRGDVTVAAALRSGRLVADGPRRMVGRLKRWLNLGPLAEVAHMRVAAE